MNEAIKMQISAFVDGELPQNEAELLLRRLCQDVELRQQAAEYLAMGRAMRGERVYAGTGLLRERISAAIDDKELQQAFEATQASPPRFMRPLAGVAIAASVALVALLGLQQLAAVPGDGEAGDRSIAETSSDGYTVPEREDDLLLDYHLSHSASASYIGAGAINTRLVTIQIRDDMELDTEDADVADERAESDDPVETPTP